MDRDQAEALLDAHEDDFQSFDVINSELKVFNKLAMLGGVERTISLQPEHDIIYISVGDLDLDELLALMTEDDVLELNRLGAHIDEAADCWAVFC